MSQHIVRFLFYIFAASKFEQRFEYLTMAVYSYHRTVIVTAAVH